MNKATVILAIVGIALLATALAGVTYAQLATQNPTATPANSSAAPWCINGNPDVSAPYCYNGTNSAPPYCYNGTNQSSPYRYNEGYGFGCHGYGYGAQRQNQNQYGYGGGMMGRWGMNSRFW
jgi:hypothetical protein